MIRVCEVRRREAARMAQLLGVWEASVRATRLFLSEQEIRRFRSYVPQKRGIFPDTVYDPVEAKGGRPYAGAEDHRLAA